ncbi:ATP-dependent zinc protease [Thalassovita sp.]|uniref:ATP-dependent zinc protease family protein n=1 Tax=Thalassovita sp. TaxID=1979401 RepID=UPI0029DE7A9E|nr:RimK/LysX family protein [Thalassovita sp.]
METQTVANPGKADRPLTVIGWMESIDLPDLNLSQIKAKIDTGARTSALHATGIVPFRRNGQRWVRFRTLIGDGRDEVELEAPVHSERAIKNTSGIPEDRFVIRTKARFGARAWEIDLSLTDRMNMTFPMIVGRAALKNHAIAVHTRRAYLMTQRPLSPKGKTPK